MRFWISTRMAMPFLLASFATSAFAMPVDPSPRVDSNLIVQARFGGGHRFIGGGGFHGGGFHRFGRGGFQHFGEYHRFGGFHRGFNGHRRFGFRRGFYGYPGYGYGPYYGGYGYGLGVAGLAAGAVIGGAIANSVHGTAYCEAHFKSYNPATRTYLGYDGRYHRCG